MGGYSNAGKPTFELDSTFTGERKAGQLLRLKPNGKLTNVLGEGNLLFFPILDDVKAGVSKSVGVATGTIREVYVETAAGITASTEVGIGSTGIGCAAHTTGFKLGQALQTPKGDGDTIAVLMSVAPQGSNY